MTKRIEQKDFDGKYAIPYLTRHVTLGRQRSLYLLFTTSTRSRSTWGSRLKEQSGGMALYQTRMTSKG